VLPESLPPEKRRPFDWKRANPVGTLLQMRKRPAVAGVLSWVLLGQRPDIGIAVGLAVGAVACWLNAKGSRQQREDDPPGDRRGEHRVDPVHHSPVAGQ